MRHLHHTAGCDEIEATAARWVLRREDGAFSEQDCMALESWLARDARHRTAYLRLKEAWQFSAGLKTWRPVDARIDPDLFRAADERAVSIRRWPLALAAACALVAVTFALIWFVLPSTYSTHVGGYQRLVLDDGSVLQLNTDTRARVRFTGKRREVQLLRGEAYFDVAADPRRPFEVIAGDAAVRAVGTAFAVRLREPQRVEVLVTQGRVALRAEDTAAAGAADVAETTPTGWRVKRLEKEEIERRLAWQTGRLHFQQEPLSAVIAEFNRYNRRRLEIADPALSGLEVYGNFKTTDVDSFVEAMRSTLDIRTEEQGGTIRLYAN